MLSLMWSSHPRIVLVLFDFWRSWGPILVSVIELWRLLDACPLILDCSTWTQWLVSVVRLDKLGHLELQLGLRVGLTCRPGKIFTAINMLPLPICKYYSLGFFKLNLSTVLDQDLTRRSNNSVCDGSWLGSQFGVVLSFGGSVITSMGSWYIGLSRAARLFHFP